MKQQKGIFLLVIVIPVFFTLCKNRAKERIETVPTLSISDKNLSRNIKLSELYKDYNYIPLETNDDCLIGQPTKIIIHENKVYILDPQHAKALFVFASDGRFIRKFSKTGRGPGEYISLEDFCIEPGTNNIVILDDNIFLKYFREDGSFIKTTRLSVPAMRFDFPDENHIAFVPCGNEDYLVITDRNGKRKSSFFKYTAETHLVLNMPFIHYGAPGLLYLTNLDYTIYRINGEKIYPHIKINFDTNMYTPGEVDVLKANPKNVDNYYQINHYFETPSNIIMLCSRKRVPYYIFYNKVTKKTVFFNCFEVENDITYTKFAPKVWANDSNDNHLSYVSAELLLNSKTNKDEMNPKIRKVINSLKMTDNPVLILYKIK
jgi:hypothetical protein